MIDTQPFGRSRADGHIFFRDAEGGVWEVHEVTIASAVPWARGERCLLFRSSSSIRRVWSYPENWRTLSQDELERLSWGT